MMSTVTILPDTGPTIQFDGALIATHEPELGFHDLYQHAYFVYQTQANFVVHHRYRTYRGLFRRRVKRESNSVYVYPAASQMVAWIRSWQCLEEFARHLERRLNLPQVRIIP